MSVLPDPATLAPQTLERATALAAPFYTAPEALAFEQAELFSRSWQLVAHVSQVAASGDHVVTDIAGVPLLVVRGDDGELRALHNVCRHRAGPLAECDGRGARSLRCRYHGWTYGLDGRLRSATEMGGAADFDPAVVRLPSVPLVVWRGLVFVSLDPVEDFATLIAQVDARLGERGFEHYAFDRRVPYEAQCNWKVYIDNYLEGYHLPHVHPGLNRLLDYRSYVVETGARHSLQYSPLADSGGIYTAGEALYVFLWPNTMLNILPGRLQTNRVVPLGIDRCRIDFDYSYAGDAGDDIQARTRDREFSDEVQHEDGAICAAVQRGLASGGYVPGRLNPKRENAVFHFHELLRSVWRERGAGVRLTR
ncbi:aromatic ring-hydroxylating oxygenase subunit alpha [Chiayiivirga flava]|uniref:Choline monooxygenase n=1 Tax=Chiayiivirga flava TaxID=659595 RepID=A0A7W8D4P1_9GAMM|nr:SRPBCC family protein [Chiayiivirga flava]MBB5206626.1 choline monooxygenase [Chiayiivirga flava]